MVSHLSESEQREVDHLNDDIRRLTEECKKMFSERLRLQYDRVQLLQTTYAKQHEHLSEVSFHRINSPHPPYMILLMSEIHHLIKQFHLANCSEFNKSVVDLNTLQTAWQIADFPFKTRYTGCHISDF
jgi:hypothetical protein